MIEFCYKYLELMTLIKVINIKQNTLIKRKNCSFFQGSDKMAEELCYFQMQIKCTWPEWVLNFYSGIKFLLWQQ